MEIILSIFNENGTIITSPILKKRVSTIILLKIKNSNKKCVGASYFYLSF